MGHSLRASQLAVSAQQAELALLKRPRLALPSPLKPTTPPRLRDQRPVSYSKLATPSEPRTVAHQPFPLSSQRAFSPLCSSNWDRMTFPTHLQPIASTSRLPPPFTPSHPSSSSRPYHSLPRALRLTPSTRTRLTNLSFISAALLSIATVSLGMSGSVKVNGVGLPCPARREAGVSLDGPKNEGEWKVEGRKERRKRRWLEDPVPIQKQETINIQDSRPAVESRDVRREQKQATTQARIGAEQAGERIAGDQQQQGWGSWAKSMLR